MNIKIRLATESDFEEVGKIFAEENRFHADLVPEIIQVAEPIMTHDWFSKVLNNSDETLFVATTKENIIGLALVALKKNIDDTIFSPRKYLHISEIAVAESHRGQGIGRSLMEKIHHWGREQGITEIELQVWERNDPAIVFYEKMGYQPWRQTMRFTLD